MSHKQQHSLRVVHRHSVLPRSPEAQTPLQLREVFQDMQAIADLIEKAVNPGEGQMQVQPVQQEP